MFESVCIRRQQPLYTSKPLDLSFLAEAMLFYQHIHLIADIDILQQLAFELGPALVNEFIEEGHLKVSYLERRPAISKFSAEAIRAGEFYHPISVGNEKGHWRLEKVAPEIFSKAAGGPGYGRQFGRRFAELVPTLDSLDFDREIYPAIQADFTGTLYVEQAIAQLLRAVAPAYQLPQDYRFQISREGELFQVDTNIDFRQANESFNQIWHVVGEFLSTSALLLYLIEVRRDLFFAARENMELATQPGNAAIIDVKFREILKAHAKSEHNIEAFQELVLANGHEIGESIKMGYRTWHDLLILLKDARRFKTWLQQTDAGASLIFEYNKALERETWIGTLPAKVLRFLIFTAAGYVVPPLAAIGLSGADAFLFDRLLGGWRPNQFVNGPLKGFARLD
jgi:hypothetical protein